MVGSKVLDNDKGDAGLGRPEECFEGLKAAGGSAKRSNHELGSTVKGHGCPRFLANASGLFSCASPPPFGQSQPAGVGFFLCVRQRAVIPQAEHRGRFLAYWRDATDCG